MCNRNGISCDLSNWDRIVSDRQKVIQTHFSAFAFEYEKNISNRNELVEIKRMFWYRIQNRLKSLFPIFQ